MEKQNEKNKKSGKKPSKMHISGNIVQEIHMNR